MGDVQTMGQYIIDYIVTPSQHLRARLGAGCYFLPYIWQKDKSLLHVVLFQPDSFLAESSQAFQEVMQVPGCMAIKS